MGDEDDKRSDELAPPQPAGDGLGSKLFDRARQARDQATAKAAGIANKAGELTGQAAAKAGELKDQAASRANDVKDQVAARANELKDAGFARVTEMLDDFNAAMPAIREAGYTLRNLDVQLSLSPRIVAKLTTPPEVPDAKVQALLADPSTTKFTATLLKALYQASIIQAKVKIAGLGPGGIDLEIGLSPSVTVRFA